MRETDIGFDRRCLHCGSLAHGKPRLSDERTASVIRFSTARTQDLALVALGAIDVGVDVERFRSVDTDVLATHTLSSTERSLLEESPVEHASTTYLQMWTRKEAVAKASGLGLALSLQAIEVVPPSGDWDCWLRVDLGSHGEWFVRSLDVGHDHSAAIATETPSTTLRVRAFQWTMAADDGC